MVGWDAVGGWLMPPPFTRMFFIYICVCVCVGGGAPADVPVAIIKEIYAS